MNQMLIVSNLKRTIVTASCRKPCWLQSPLCVITSQSIPPTSFLPCVCPPAAAFGTNLDPRLKSLNWRKWRVWFPFPPISCRTACDVTAANEAMLMGNFAARSVCIYVCAKQRRQVRKKKAAERKWNALWVWWSVCKAGLYIPLDTEHYQRNGGT